VNRTAPKRQRSAIATACPVGEGMIHHNDVDAGVDALNDMETHWQTPPSNPGRFTR